MDVFHAEGVPLAVHRDERFRIRAIAADRRPVRGAGSQRPAERFGNEPPGARPCSDVHVSSRRGDLPNNRSSRRRAGPPGLQR